MRRLSSERGFTLIEILISLGLTGLLLTILMSVQNIVSQQGNKQVRKLETSVDSIVGERTLFIDFSGASPSFNTLQLKDDRGNLFFDYYSDVPDAFLAQANRDRVFTLEAGKNVFYILVQSALDGPLLNYDPVAAYNVGPAPADFNVAAALSYVSVNNKNWISSQRPLFWKQDKLLFFDTNIFERTSSPVNMAEAPTSPAFLGSVDASSNQVAPTTLGAYLKGSSRSADAFLRGLPSRGGGLPFVKVRSVRFYRYYLQAYQDDRVEGTPSRLMRDEYLGGAFKNSYMISDKVKSVKFSRESVMNKVVQFSIQKAADKKTK